MSASITTLPPNKTQDPTAPSSTQAQKPSLRPLWQEQATDLIKNAGLAYQKHSANCYKYATIAFLAKFSTIILTTVLSDKEINTFVPFPILVMKANQIYTDNIYEAQKRYFKEKLGSPFLQTLAGAATSKLIFRFGLQEVLLKRLPKSLLEKQVSKERANKIVDSNAAKAARILITSASIAFITTKPYKEGFRLDQLACSFLYNLGLGILQEQSKTPLLHLASVEIGAKCGAQAASKLLFT